MKVTQDFNEAREILNTLEDNGYEAYYVGGAVRDYLMNESIGDIDITTNALPEDIQSLFKRTIDVGVEHGTVVVLVNKTPYEVTTYRTETTYSDFRRPDSVEFTTSLKEDLSRRDFTMNAIAMDKNFNIIDSFNGQKAIKEKEIVTVGRASDRFFEDALRMLRAIRFMSQLDFKLNEETKKAIFEHVENVKHISVERIVQELKKLYIGKNVFKGKEVLIESELYTFIPFLKDVSKENLVSSNVHHLLDEIIIQLILDHTLKFNNDLKLSNNERNFIKQSVQLYNDLADGISNILIAYHYDIEVLKRLKEIVSNNKQLNQNFVKLISQSIHNKNNLPIQSKKDIALNGNDLMQALNRTGGPWLKEMLNEIEREILFNRLNNNFKDIIEWVKLND